MMSKKLDKHSDHQKALIIEAGKTMKPAGKRRRITSTSNALLSPIHFKNLVNILFVEDNVFNQELASFILNKIGCNTEIANNGKEAIEILRVKQYDLILMDINMPVLDGYETTRILREHLFTETPIIAFTTNVLDEDIQRCIDYGMNDHLGKPYTEQELSSIIYKWTNQNK